MNMLLSTLVALNFYVRAWYAFSAIKGKDQTMKLLPSLSPACAQMMMVMQQNWLAAAGCFPN